MVAAEPSDDTGVALGIVGWGIFALFSFWCLNAVVYTIGFHLGMHGCVL